MNVGVLIEDYSPEMGGGYTIQADILQSFFELAEESEYNFILFLSGKKIPGYPHNPVSDKIRIISYSRLDKIEALLNRIRSDYPQFYKIWSKPCKLERMALKDKIDIMWFISPGLIDIDIPYITIVWDLQHRLQPWFPEVSEKGIWDNRERFYSRSLQKATYIITGSEVGQKEIERFYQIPPERIKILPHPTPRYALNAPLLNDKSILEKYGIPKGYLFYPAQFWSHKNHANLLKSAKILRDKLGVILPVVFIGSDHGNLTYIKQLVRDLDLSPQVHFLGFVPQEDLISLYRQAFALTYVTFFGPENLPPLEAFALGCPVIASNVAGAEEQLGDAAILVDPKKPDEIALAIKSLYENSDLREGMIAKGFKRASQWTGKDFVRGIFSILEEFEPVRSCWSRAGSK